MTKIFLIVFSVFVLNAANLWAAPENSDQDADKKDLASMTREDKALPNQIQGKKVYMCPMCPGVHESKPGKCPKCGMDLQAATLKAVEQTKTHETGMEEIGNGSQPQEQAKQNVANREPLNQ